MVQRFFFLVSLLSSAVFSTPAHPVAPSKSLSVEQRLQRLEAAVQELQGKLFKSEAENAQLKKAKPTKYSCELNIYGRSYRSSAATEQEAKEKTIDACQFGNAGTTHCKEPTCAITD